jgi:hypothetical protein
MNDNIFVPQGGAIAALTSWLAATDAPLLAHLYVNNINYVPTRVLADYTEASFVGYAAQGPIGWGPVFTNGVGKAESDSPNLTWTFTGATGTFPVFGIYLTNVTITKLLCVIPFLHPVILTPTAPALTRSLQITDRSEL